MSQYFGFGADLQRNDLYYVKNLLMSIDVDLDAIISDKGASFTASKAKLLMDKTTLANAAIEKLNAIGAAAQPVLSANQNIAGEISVLQAKIPAKRAAVEKYAVVAEASPAAFPPYKQGVPFTAPPEAQLGLTLAPDAAILSKLNAPISSLITKEQKAQYYTNLTGARHPVAASAPAGKNTGLLVGAAALAAIFLLNR